ncbi:ComEC/Rec2 family competence protein [Mangrovibacter sp. SLW1]
MLLQPRFIQEGCTHKWQLAMGFSFCIGKLAAQGEHCAAITQTQSLDFGRDKPITLVANHSSILAYSCVYLRWSMGVLGKHSLIWRYCACCALALSWALFHAQTALTTMAEMSGKRETFLVRIISTQGERHQGKVVQWGSEKILFAPGVTLYGVLPESQPCPGQIWQVSGTLRPVHGQYNAGGYSRQRSALANGFVLSGRMAGVQVIKPTCSLRSALIHRVEQQTAHFVWKPVIHALAFGERASVSANVRQILRETGTAHLMAISGLHIAQAGGAGWLLARLIQFFLPAHWIRPSFPIITSIICAAGYTWLSGGNPPAVRSLIALSTWGIIRLYQRQWGHGMFWLYAWPVFYYSTH